MKETRRGVRGAHRVGLGGLGDVQHAQYFLKCRSGLANLAEEAIPPENRGDAVLCTAQRRLRARVDHLGSVQFRRSGKRVHLFVSVEDVSQPAL